MKLYNSPCKKKNPISVEWFEHKANKCYLVYLSNVAFRIGVTKSPPDRFRHEHGALHDTRPLEETTTTTTTKNRSSSYSFGGFLKWWYLQNTPKWSFLVGKPMIVGYHHFRKPPFHSQIRTIPRLDGTKRSRKTLAAAEPGHKKHRTAGWWLETNSNLVMVVAGCIYYLSKYFLMLLFWGNASWFWFETKKGNENPNYEEHINT